MNDCVENVDCKNLCNVCQAVIPDGAKFCPECGAKLDSQTVCSNCGFQNGSIFKFCPECGTKQKPGKSPETIARLQELEKLTPNLESLISAILDGKTDKDDSGKSIFPFRATCFRNLLTANAAKVYGNAFFFKAAVNSTIQGMSFVDFSLTADELIEEFKNQLLLASPQVLLEENLIAKSLQKRIGVDCSEILYDEYMYDSSYLEDLKGQLDNLYLQIQRQAVYYPQLLQAIDALNNYKPKDDETFARQNAPKKDFFTAKNFVEAGRIAAGLYFGQTGSVLNGLGNILSNVVGEDENYEPEQESENDDEYDQLVENYESICRQIMNIAEDGFNAVLDFEIEFVNYHTSFIKEIKNLATNEYSVLYRLLEKGFSVEQIASAIDERTEQWKQYCQIGNQFGGLEENSDDEDFSMLDMFTNALDSLVEVDPVKLNDQWNVWCTIYGVESDAECLMYYPKEDSPTIEDLSERLYNLMNTLQIHSDADKANQVLAIVNGYFRNTNVVYVHPYFSEDSNVDPFSVNSYFDFETMKIMRDSIAKNIWLEDILLAIYDGKNGIGVVATSKAIYIMSVNLSWSVNYNEINNIGYYTMGNEFSTKYCLKVNQYDFQYNAAVGAELKIFCDFINNSRNQLQ